MNNSLFDSHCHVHAIDGDLGDTTVKKWHDGGATNADDVVQSAHEAGVSRMLCVGTELEDSRLAVEFVQNRPNMWASVGVHPHDGAHFVDTEGSREAFEGLLQTKNDKIVAIGECGLDYYYENSPKADQIQLLEFQLKMAEKYGLPLVLHVREAYDDFWPIFDQFKNLSGVVHSFTGTKRDMEAALSRDLYIGLNGIMTFTRDDAQLEMAKAVPLEKLMLETDAPYLTPKPLRGKICKPEHVKLTAEFLAELREEHMGQLAAQTTQNACFLFGLKQEYVSAK